MAPLPVIANTYRCALNWAAGAQIAENVIHVRAPSSDAAGVFAALELGASGNMWASVASAATVETISITPLDGSSSTTDFTPTGSAWHGAATGNFSPQVACTVSLATGIRGRSHRGRVYVPFTAEVANINGDLNSTQLASMQAAWNSFLTGMGSGFTMVVASYKLASATDVSKATVRVGLSTQRRRQTRVSYP